MFDKVPQEFVPEGTVDQILKPENVMFALGIKESNGEEASLIEFIMVKARKAFAVSIMAKINANQAMRWLKDRNMTDDDLPVTTKDTEWQKSWRPEFCNFQWMFFATVFSTKNHGHKLEESHIIPFIKKIQQAGQGSFGIVSQYSIHKAHIELVGFNPQLNEQRTNHSRRSSQIISMLPSRRSDPRRMRKR